MAIEQDKLDNFKKLGITLDMVNGSGQLIDKDKPHLGGNQPRIMKSSYVPNSWKYILDHYDIKTALDIGGGFGFCTKWFIDQGVDCTLVDGLEYNVTNGVASDNGIVHDLQDGPVNHEEVDLVVCIEVVEHVKEEYLKNLLDSLALGKYILMTFATPGQAGWHHVNCQPEKYWLDHLSKYGYSVLQKDQNQIRNLARKEGGTHIQRSGLFLSRK
jgi:2-polyprenyl-3-methyl-5-hydroxy-6-metoxy-1,4-benzoquinol methylase